MVPGNKAEIADPLASSPYSPLLLHLSQNRHRLPRMHRLVTVLFLVFFSASCASAQGSTADETAFRLALPNHRGQLQWRANGFTVLQSSAKENGNEIGIRGRDSTGLTYLAFLFLVPEQNSLTSGRCRDGVLGVERKEAPAFKLSATSELQRPGALPLALATYTEGTTKKTFSARGFIATADICGDIQFYDQSPIDADDPRIKGILETFQLDPAYVPQFHDAFVYAQILYKAEHYSAAAPIFEQALTMLGDAKEAQTWRRVTTDQAGMSYGISGNIAKAREIFNTAILKDPDYPMFYYNLACADAEENKLFRRPPSPPGSIRAESKCTTGRKHT